MLKLANAFTAFAIFASAGAAAAQARNHADTPTAVVSYADLELGSSAGLRALEARVYAAASRLCVHDGRKSLQQELAERRCMSAAVSNGRAGIDQAAAQHGMQFARRSQLATR
jgi:UrcA family protein